ncbi:MULTISPECIES: methyl-accepting chemotaxis protein [Herbaspirillum]|uniref:methyl-accepting chemotaxis protein n=1 Tax=Herbaspirillum TaxID=963 RepID=UPI0012AD139E|nr:MULTISPECIES: methyl-accepting chemotaxis protein [Herbaspirillum]MBW9336626.1 HAMP domain-containing protein [Herbaspirillum sp. RU 5E]MRT31922.1 HAMP domain-containing protein [Herbaspirillum sp. CAH-3]
MLTRMKLRTGLVLVLGLLTLALWLAVGMAWQGARSASRATVALIELSDRHIQPLHDTERLFLSTLINMDNAYINLVKGDEIKSNDYSRRASAALQEARKAFDGYRQGLSPQALAEPEALRVSAAYDSYVKVLNLREVALYDVSLEDYAAATVSAEAADREFAATLRAVIEHAQQVKEELRQASERRSEQASLLAGAMLAASLLLIGICWLLFDRLLLQPLKRAAAHFDRIADGDLSRPVQGISGNEIGVLLAALQRMQAGVARTVGDIREATRDLHHGAAEIAQGNGELAQRTQAQASTLETTAATLERLSGAVRNNARNAERTNALAADAARDAQRGGQVMSGIAGAMAQVTAGAGRISDIVSVIDGIAFQTNILALNASVEAARAGSQGRGFAVVASEVRSLALRSAEAAREVKDLIATSIGSVDQAAQQVKEADQAIVQIVQSFGNVMTTVNEIATATREQAEGISQVSLSLADMDRATQQNAALVEQTSAGADALAEQAAALTASVAVFTLATEPSKETAERANAVALPLPSLPALSQ